MRQRLMHGEGYCVLHCAAIVLIVFLLAACSLQRGSTSSGNSRTGGKNPASIHVGFLSETKSLDFAQEMAAGAQYAANQYHVSAQIVAPPTFDDPASLKLFNNLVQTARDGIAIQTLAPDLFVQAENNALRQDIPVIAVDVPPPPVSHITSYIGNDNLAAGKLLADAAIKLIPTQARGQVLVGIDNMAVSILHLRARGMVQEFRRLRPALQIVGPFNSRQPPQQNLATWSSVITTYPALVACLGVGDADNASLAQIKLNRHSTYLGGAFDLDPTALQAIANGTNFALVDPEHFLKGYVAMRLLIEHALYGNAIPQGWWNPGAMLVTPRNVQQIIRRQMSLAAKGQFYQELIDQQFANPAAQIKRLDQAT